MCFFNEFEELLKAMLLPLVFKSSSIAKRPIPRLSLERSKNTSISRAAEHFWPRVIIIEKFHNLKKRRGEEIHRFPMLFPSFSISSVNIEHHLGPFSFFLPAISHGAKPVGFYYSAATRQTILGLQFDSIDRKEGAIYLTFLFSRELLASYLSFAYLCWSFFSIFFG